MLAVTNDEESNLAIAIAARLLNPNGAGDRPRAAPPSVAANMASFGTDHIINPFERFAEHLALAVSAPERFRLIELLTSLPETPIPELHRPPRGHWILCGYGRFGHAIANRLAADRDQADHHRPAAHRTPTTPLHRRRHRGTYPATRRNRTGHRQPWIDRYATDAQRKECQLSFSGSARAHTAHFSPRR